MSNIIDTKPEPISAKPNWYYDSYFLSQLDRLNIRKLHDGGSSRQGMEQRVDKTGDKAPEEIIMTAVAEKREVQNRNRNEVVRRINELARSIGISVTIIDNPNHCHHP